MCYYYDGDGVCEDFERETGVRDCGLYTPSGFLDQWAATVEVSHELKPYCSGEVAAGYPAVTKVTLVTTLSNSHSLTLMVFLLPPPGSAAKGRARGSAFEQSATQSLLCTSVVYRVCDGVYSRHRDV